jgi:dolichol kinase
MSSPRIFATTFFRKTLHFLIALTPLLAAFNYQLTVLLLCAGTLFFIFAEDRRFHGGGGGIPLISKITMFVSHNRDKTRFVLGPVTLGAGALFALLILPPESFAVAIYALAFGDGFAGLAGRIFGKFRPKILCGKSMEGSAACFIAIFISARLVTGNGRAALICALAGSVIEAAPTEDFDNILIPLGVGITAVLTGAAS